MKAHLTVFALSAVLIASIGMTPAFGQIQDPIVVTTDKEAYSDGEMITITGKVRDLYSQTPVSVIVTAPNGSIVTVYQVDIDADREFSVQLTPGGTMKAEGTYTVKVTYGSNRTAETTFEYDGFVPPTTPPDDSRRPGVTDTTVAIEGTDDLISYVITGGKLLGVIPQPPTSLIIQIEAIEDGSLTITIPRTVFDAKSESGEDIDVFVLVDSEETDFEETATETDRTYIIGFSEGAEEIEMIGTFVIPEFGTIAAMILAVAIISIIAITARSKLSIMPRY